MKSAFLTLVGLMIVGGYIFLFFNKQTTDTRTDQVEQVEQKTMGVVKINDKIINVEIANTPETRIQGLSGKLELQNGSGMFFIFDRPERYGFWMKDMNFAIDIIWISESLHVVGIEREVSPLTFPQTFVPNEPVKYVLEVPSRFAENYGIDIGAVVYLE